MAIFNTVYGGKGTIPKSGLLGYRPLQSDAKDYSGNGKDGTWTGTASYETAGGYTGARTTTSGNYSSATSYITTTLNYANAPVTFVGWARWNEFKDRCGFISNMNAVSAEYNAFWISGVAASGNTIRYGNGTNGTKDTSYSISTNTWYCIGVTVSTTETKVYVNGNLIGTFAGGSNASVGSIWRLGCGIYSVNVINNWQGINGYIRHCAVYNRILSADEMKKYYDITQS